jgi:trimeric autotransporter adhesin
MRRFLTLVCLLGLALPAGISISGCTRNPGGKYCNGQYGLLNTSVDYITLQPQIAGISLAYGQTIQAQAPTASTCLNTPASVASSLYHYGTTNNQLVDISPSGNICAGTWNRNTGGGIADYTYCNFPNPLPSTNGLPYAIAYITATADGVTSNPVAVYVHAPISSISLVTTPVSGGSAPGCYSQNQQANLDAEAFYSTNSTQELLCAPGSATLPECTSSIGTLSYSVGTSSVASINPATNVITAELPGTTVINATIAQSSSAAGYFTTCPPKSIDVTLANGSTKGVITQGVSQNLTTTILDTQNNPITGLTLGYQSTNPIEITTTSGGAITAAYPGVASVYATCQPPSCNPAPINELGLSGTGLPLASNPINIIVPGTTSDFAWVGAPGQSQYISSIEVLNGTPGITTRLPYVPNSMVMDQSGISLYFGSQRELMIYSTSSNSLTKQDTTAPGVVLAASPNGSQILVNDQIRGLFYLYNTSSGSSLTETGLGVAAQWTPDSNTLYVVDNAAAGPGHTNTLYVYNTNTGWSSYDLSSSSGAQNLAVTVPGIGAYLAGPSTVAHTWCPSGIVGNNASIEFYPESDALNGLSNSVMAATSDGKHILGAEVVGTAITLNDIDVSIPPSAATPSAQCPETTTGTTETLAPLSTNPTQNPPVNLTGVANAATANQIVTGYAPTTASVNTAAPIAFVTYNAPSSSTAAAQLPYYLPAASGTGTVGSVKFCEQLPPPSGVNASSQCVSPTGALPTAPLAGAFSPDNSLFLVSTAGDNAIHFITIPTNLSTSAPADSSTTLQVSGQYQLLTPNLPACTPVSEGGNDAGCQYPTTLPAPTSTTYVPATVIEVKPRSVT